MKHLRFYWLICSIALGVCEGGCGKPQLLREAGQLAKQGQEAEKTDFAAAVRLYQAALKKVEDFSAQSSASSKPDQRVGDETRIGPYTVAELRDRVLPQVQQKNAAQEDPLSCAFVLALSTKNPAQRSALFTEVAKSYAALGQDDQVQKIVGFVLGDFVTANAVLDEGAQEESGGMWKAMGAPDEEALKIANSTKAAVLSFLDNVIGQYFTLGRAGRAWALLQLMSGQEQEEMRDAGWNSVVFHHADLGQLEEALGASTFIVDPAMRAGALIKIANQYTEVGQSALAVDWGDWNTVGQWPPVPRSLRQVFLAPYEDAEQLALHIDRWSLIPQWTDPEIPMRVVFFPYGKGRAAGILVQAQRVAETIEEFSDRVTQLTGVVQGYVAAEHYNRALALIGKFRDPEPKAKLLTIVAAQYANTGHAELARPLLDQVVQIAKTLIDPSVRTEVMKNAARIYIAAGREEAALQIARAFKDAFARAEVLQTVVRKEAACDHMQEALLLAHTIADDEDRADALTAIAKAYVVSGQLKRATNLTSQIDQDLPAVAHRYIENGQVRQAERVAEAVSDTAKRAEVLTAIARSLFTTGDEAGGEGVLKRALLAAEAVEDEQERDKMRTTMSRELMAGHQKERARRVAETIADPAEQAIELAEIARSFFAGGDNTQGAALLAHALRVGREIHDPVKRARTTANIGKRMMTAGYLSQAYDVTLQLENVAMRSETLADVARVGLESGQYEWAVHAATTIPDPFIKSRTFAAIARRAITEGRYDDARQYATAISTISEKEEVLVGLAHRYATLGRQDEALTLVQMIKSAHLKTRVLADVALAYVANNQEDRLDIFLSSIEDAFTRAQVTAEVARQYALSGQRQKALLLADAIVDIGLRRRTLKTIAERGGEGENVELANMLPQVGQERTLREIARAGRCEQAQQMTSGIPDSKGRVNALLDIARLCCESGQREQCKGIITQAMQETRSFSNGQDRSELLSRIARQLVAIGEREQAVDSAKQIEEKAARAEALINIGRSYLEENQEDHAVALIQTIGENRSAKLLTILVRKRLETKQWDSAVEAARRITDPYTRVKTLLDIVSTCMDNGQKDKAKELLPLVLQDVASLEGVRTHAEVLARVARFYLSLGSVEQTLQVAQAIKEPAVRAAVFVEVVKEESGSGRLVSAAQLAADITNLDLQTEAITAVIYEYLARKDYEAAFALAILVKDQDARKDLVTAVAREELSCGDAESQEVRGIGARGSWKKSREECSSTEPATLIRAYITSELYEHANQLIELTEDPGKKILLLVELARGYARSGEKDKVEALLERVLNESSSLPDVATKETALAGVGMLALQTGLPMSEEMKKALLQMVGQVEKVKGETAQDAVVGQAEKRKWDASSQ